MSELARQVVAELDPGSVIDNKVVLSRRQLVAIAGSGLGAGALATLGVDEATAQSAVGAIGTPDSREDAYLATADVEALDADGMVIGDDYHYAGYYDGADADARLDAALSAATSGDCIYLENETYITNRTITTNCGIYGTTDSFAGAAIDADWDLSAIVTLSGLSVSGSQTITILTDNCAVTDSTFGGSAGVVVDASECRITSITGGGADVTVTFNSGSSNGLVDSAVGVSVTDNGTNTVGDIS